MGRAKAIEVLRGSGICAEFKDVIENVINAFADPQPNPMVIEIGDIVEVVDGVFSGCSELAGCQGIVRTMDGGGWGDGKRIGVEFFKDFPSGHSLDRAITNDRGRFGRSSELRVVTKGAPLL